RPRNAGLQRAWSVQRHQLAVIYDGDAVTQTISFIHVVRSDQDRKISLLFDIADHLPNCHAGYRVKSSSRLIQEEDSWAMHQPTRNFQPSAHPAGEIARRSIAPLRQVHQLEKFVNGPFPLGCADAIKLGINAQVLPYSEV